LSYETIICEYHIYWSLYIGRVESYVFLDAQSIIDASRNAHHLKSDESVTLGLQIQKPMKKSGSLLYAIFRKKTGIFLRKIA
jgi:hypothetical protein